MKQDNIFLMKRILFLLFFILSGCTFYPHSASDLIGLTDYQITRRFKEPTVIRTEGTYQLWSYRKNNCTTLLYFDETKTVQFVDFSGDCSLSS